MLEFWSNTLKPIAPLLPTKTFTNHQVMMVHPKADTTICVDIASEAGSNGCPEKNNQNFGREGER